MFMAELKNGLKLTKIKLSNNFLSFRSILFAILLASLIPCLTTLISMIFEKSNAVQSLDGVSSVGIILIFIFLFVKTIILIKNDEKYTSIFPQTNSGRFISNLLCIHIPLAIFIIALILIYVIQYGLFSIFASDDNVVLILDFSLFSIVFDLFCHYLYMTIGINLILLVIVFLNKFPSFAGVLIFTILLNLFPIFSIFIKQISQIISFFQDEPNFLVFLLKILLVNIIILSLVFIITYFTNINEIKIVSSKAEKAKKTLTTISLLICAIILSFILYSITSTVSPNGFIVDIKGYAYEDINATYWSLDLEPGEGLGAFEEKVKSLRPEQKFETKTINISVPANELNLMIPNAKRYNKRQIILNSCFPVCPNELKRAPGDEVESSALFDLKMFVVADKSLEANEVVCKISKPMYMINGVDVYKDLDTNLDISLISDELYLDYTINNTLNVISLKKSSLFENQFLGRESISRYQNTYYAPVVYIFVPESSF